MISGPLDSDAVVVSCPELDADMRKSDLGSVIAPHFLTDAAIGFFLRVLIPDSPDALAVAPATAFMGSVVEGQALAEMVAPLGLGGRKSGLVLFPVNDSTSPDVPLSGSHWSLLVWDVCARAWRHYDSASGYNEPAARRLAKAFAVTVGAPGDAPFTAAPVPRQVNGHDCGVHVIANARALTLGRPLPASVEGMRDELIAVAKKYEKQDN